MCAGRWVVLRLGTCVVWGHESLKVIGEILFDKVLSQYITNTHTMIRLTGVVCMCVSVPDTKTKMTVVPSGTNEYNVYENVRVLGVEWHARCAVTSG